MLPLPLTTALAAGYLLAAAGCPAMPHMAGDDTQMSFTHKAPVIENDKDAATLGSYNVSTTFSRSRNEIFKVGGLHLSEFVPRFIISYNVAGRTDGKVCIAPASVSIAVHYEPRVLIASEYEKGSCMYGKVLEHEMQHVNVDIITFKELLPQLQKSVQAAAMSITPMGPMPEASLETAKNILTEKIKDALVASVEEIEQIRFNRQQRIDTRQEYLRISGACR